MVTYVCQNGVETRKHIFGLCPVVAPLFDKLFYLVGITKSPLQPFSLYIDLFTNSTRKWSALYTLRDSLFCVVIDKVWSLRNALIFRHEKVDISVACKLVGSVLLRFGKFDYSENRPSRCLMARLRHW